MTKISKTFIIISCFFLLIKCQNDRETDTISRIIKQKKVIHSVCKVLDINPRLYVSVIYSELINNFNALDNFDEFRARIGSNASIGFAQIKLSTCYWIEKNYSGKYGIYNSNSNKELVDKIVQDSINIHYSGVYIKLILDFFYRTHKDYKVDAKNIASYYGIGIDEIDRKADLRYSNILGITADSFYYSRKLLDIFPK